MFLPEVSSFPTNKCSFKLHLNHIPNSKDNKTSISLIVILSVFENACGWNCTQLLWYLYYSLKNFVWNYFMLIYLYLDTFMYKSVFRYLVDLSEVCTDRAEFIYVQINFMYKFLRVWLNCMFILSFKLFLYILKVSCWSCMF